MSYQDDKLHFNLNSVTVLVNHGKNCHLVLQILNISIRKMCTKVMVGKPSTYIVEHVKIYKTIHFYFVNK